VDFLWVLQESRKDEVDVDSVVSSLSSLVDNANVAFENLLEIVPEADLAKGQEIVRILRDGDAGAIAEGEPLEAREAAAGLSGLL
jgi:hypothetical protein